MWITKKINKKSAIYRCEVLIKSKCLNHLNTWTLLILGKTPAGSKLKIKRFTLLCSPLGNKRSKDQFEFREWGLFFCVENINPSYILYLSQTILIPAGIKMSLRLSHKK